MRTIDIVISLQAKGHIVEFYERPDGGIRVTRIDNETFSKSGSKGNTAARNALHVKKISSKQQKHLLKNRKKITKEKLSKREQKQLQEYNKRVKKLNNEKLKPLSKKTAKQRKKREGSKSLYKAMKNNLRHYSGLAYRGNVEWFIGVLENRDAEGYAKVISWLKRHINTILDKTLTDCHHIFYDMELTTEQKVTLMLSTLKESQQDKQFLESF